jgi:hypothetical protein
MFGVGSFFIPLAAEACSQFLGSPLAVFWLVGAVSFLSTLPFLFVSSPQKPKPDAETEGDDGPAHIELKTNKVMSNLYFKSSPGHGATSSKVCLKEGSWMLLKPDCGDLIPVQLSPYLSHA